MKTMALAVLLLALLGQGCVALAENGLGIAWVSAALLLFLGVWFLVLLEKNEPVVAAFKAGWLWLIPVAFLLLLRGWHWNALLAYPLGDEGNEAIDVFEIAQGAYLPVFLPRGGRLPITDYLAAPVFQILGPTVGSLRVIPLLLGLLTFLLVVLTVRRWSGERAAFCAALLLAAGWWPAFVGRAGDYAGSAAFWTVLCVYLLTLTLQKGGWGPALLLGVSAGLGAYSYTGFWAFFLFAAAVLVLEVSAGRMPRPLLHRLWAGAGLTVLLLVPLAVYALRHPEFAFLRVRDTAVFGQAGWGLVLLFNAFAVTAGFFGEWQTLSLMDKLAGAFLVMGLAVCLKDQRERGVRWVLAGLFCFALPGILSGTSNTVFRLGGMMLFVFALAGTGMEWFVRRTGRTGFALTAILVWLMVPWNTISVEAAFKQPSLLGFLDIPDERTAGRYIRGMLEQGHEYFCGFDPFVTSLEELAGGAYDPGRSVKDGALFFRIAPDSRVPEMVRKVPGCRVVRVGGLSYGLMGRVDPAVRSRIQEIRHLDRSLLRYEREDARRGYERLLSGSAPWLQACLLERLALMDAGERHFDRVLLRYRDIERLGFRFTDVAETVRFLREKGWKTP